MPAFQGKQGNHCRRGCGTATGGGGASQRAAIQAATTINPTPLGTKIDDPRYPAVTGTHPKAKALGVIGFYFEGKNAPVDDKCHSGIFGNFWDVTLDGVGTKIIVGGTDSKKKRTRENFSNTETAFQALKWWEHRDKFTKPGGFFVSAGKAYDVKKDLEKVHGKGGATHAGYENKWSLMWVSLESKFLYAHYNAAQGLPLSNAANALIASGDAWLQERGVFGRNEKVWSDFGDGSGENKLGIMLMLIRDILTGKSANPKSWTAWLSAQIATGQTSSHYVAGILKGPDVHDRPHEVQQIIVASANLMKANHV